MCLFHSKHYREKQSDHFRSWRKGILPFPWSTNFLVERYCHKNGEGIKNRRNWMSLKDVFAFKCTKQYIYLPLYSKHEFKRSQKGWKLNNNNHDVSNLLLECESTFIFITYFYASNIVLTGLLPGGNVFDSSINLEREEECRMDRWMYIPKSYS